MLVALPRLDYVVGRRQTQLRVSPLTTYLATLSPPSNASVGSDTERAPVAQDVGRVLQQMSLRARGRSICERDWRQLPLSFVVITIARTSQQSAAHSSLRLRRANLPGSVGWIHSVTQNFLVLLTFSPSGPSSSSERRAPRAQKRNYQTVSCCPPHPSNNPTAERARVIMLPQTACSCGKIPPS